MGSQRPDHTSTNISKVVCKPCGKVELSLNNVLLHEDKLISTPSVLAGADKARPRSMRIGKEVIRGPNDKIVSNALWLNHNNLESFNGLVLFCNKIFEAPSRIKWIDLSYNAIEEISEEILKFKELQILYLHGNCIDSMLDILKLKRLKNLRTLTLHGCPIETVPFYRQKMVYLLPQVKNLDFVTITPREAVAPAPPGARELLKVYETEEK